jgi:hypothetical protein
LAYGADKRFRHEIGEIEMKRVHHILAVGAMAVLGTTQAMAALEPGQQHYYLQTGSDLQKVCANPQDSHNIDAGERERLLVCGSYIQGFLGHYGLVRRDLGSVSFCLPASGVSGEQVRLLFLNLLQQKPQISDLPASVDLATSLAWGYSCASQASDKTAAGGDKARPHSTAQ